MIDKLKISTSLLLVLAGVAGFYMLADSPVILRVLAVLGGIVLAAVVALTSAPGKQFHAFAQDSVTETKKVVWPTRQETIRMTGVVFAFVVVMAIFLWLVDAGLLWLVKLLMGRTD